MSKVTWIDARPRDPATGAETLVLLAGGGRTKPYRKTSGGPQYRAGLATQPRFTAALGFDQDGWTGGTLPVTGNMLFRPAQPELLDELAGLLWNDAPITIEAGPEGGPYAAVLTGTVKSAAAIDDALQLEVTVDPAALSRPFLSARFAGTGGVEGGVEAAGRIKRRSWGRVFNVEGRVFDKAWNLYEFGDPAFPFQEFSVVRDKGRDAAPAPVLVDWAGSVAATIDALKAAAAPEGSCAVAAAIAMVKWWTQPAGPLTADIKGEIDAAYVETAPEIAASVSAAVGGPAIANASAIAAVRPGAAGIHIGDENETAAQALDRLLLGVSLHWTLDPAGVIELGEWSFADPVEALVSRKVTRRQTFLPMKTRRVGYQKAERIHTDGEISAAVLVGDVDGLGDLATQDDVDFDSQVTGPGKPEPGATVGGRFGLPANGGNVYYEGGLPVVDVEVITSQGTAAAITGQSRFATAGSISYGDADVLGFGGLAGKSKAAWDADMSAMPYWTRDVTAPIGGDPLNTRLKAGYAVYNSGVQVDQREPQEAGANVTETRISAAVSGQGPFATATGGQSLDNGALFAMPIRLQTIANGDVRFLRAENVIFAATSRAVADVEPAEAGANVTETRTAAAITGQSRFATAGSINYGDADVLGFGGLAGKSKAAWDADMSAMPYWTRDVTAPIGGDPLNTRLKAGYMMDQAGTKNLDTYFPEDIASNRTETRTAAAIAGQTDWATYSGINTTSMAGRVSRLGVDGKIADGRALNASNNFGLRSLFDPPAVSDTDNAGSVTINIGSTVFYPDWGGTITFPSATVPGAAYGTTYWIYRTGVDPVNAPTGTGWAISTNVLDALGTGKVKVTSYTTRASGSSPSPPPPPPPPAGCVWAEAWVEVRDPHFRAGRSYRMIGGLFFVRARHVVAGDHVRVLSDDRRGTRWEAVTDNRLTVQDGLRLIAGRFALSLSVSTPISLRDGRDIRAPDVAGELLPVFARALRWARCRIEPIGKIEVAHIRCSMKTYAAGDVAGLSILTHNPSKP